MVMSKKKELVLDIKDIVIFVLKRWLFILILTLVCAIVLGGSKAIAFYRDSEDRYGDEAKHKVLKDLTDIEINEVENLFDRYIAYKNRISYSESYLSDSILMELNPYSLASLTVEYSVTSDQYSTIVTLTSGVLRDADYEQIASLFNKSANNAHISDIVKISNSSGSADETEIDIINVTDSYSGTVKNTYHCIIRLNAMADTAEHCKSIMTIMENAFQAKKQELDNIGISVSADRIGDYYTDNSSSWLADKQRDMISEASDLKAEYDSFEKTSLSYLSAEEKDYFNFLKDANSGKVVKLHNAANFITGGIAGLTIALLIILLVYFASGKVRNAEDYLFRVSNDSILGTVYSVSEKKGLLNRFINLLINKWFYEIDKTYDNSEDSRILAKRIRQICKHNNTDDLYVINGSSREGAAQVLKSITDDLEQEGIKVYCGKPLSNSGDFEVFEQKHSVLVFGSFFDSKVKELADYYKLSGETGSSVIGCVLHREV